MNTAPAIAHIEEPLAVLRSALEHARHLVPAQSPLDRFVHHNPLHHFEDLPFDEAVQQAASIFENEPYWSESAYRESFSHGRIQSIDLEAVLASEVAPGRVADLVERRELVRLMLRHPIERLGGEALQWTLTETDVLSAPRADLPPQSRAMVVAEAGGDQRRAMQHLWAVCEQYREVLPTPGRSTRVGTRIRDQLVARGASDPDVLVHPVLIRWCAGFLDHGVAYWPMADRKTGFYRVFIEHFSQTTEVIRPWMRTVREIARRALRESWTHEDLTLHVLQRLGHPMDHWHDVVLQALLALRGWSGMFQRLRDRPDTAPEHLDIPTDLADLLAVRLLLDLAAANKLLPVGEQDATLAERCLLLDNTAEEVTRPDPAWVLFQVAQLVGIGAHSLDDVGPERVRALMAEVNALAEVERRRLWHAAYERRFRTETLDAIAVHTHRTASVSAPERRVQAAFCIDDREESMRRHLEEVAPWVETIGVAGNYGISMYYQGLEHGHPVALGPGGFEPRHLVKEESVDGTFERVRWQGIVRHNVNVGSQTLFRGAMVALGGVFSAGPLSLRLLAPRLAAQLTKRDLPQHTTLALERVDDHLDAHGLLRGFSVDEMVDIVQGTLEFMALLRDFAPLVFCLGHGSKSMNNPHEAAHDCGACGGGRGGPNGRAFARMANDSRVREALAARGIEIPESTWFVGGYHNTADDDITLYDLDLVPADLHALLQETQAAFEEARAADALERCRKFESVPLTVTPAMALHHVENRDEDLAQPRPEYGHCTNAICLVGRRSWSRGLFLDRRAFLCSYDPDLDPDGGILSRLLAMAVPVGAGINLEYWFSVVDPARYGCGTKLPHNITGLIGVMDGHQSDLRTGLPWQMVEIHEPVRLLCVVEATPERLLQVASDHPSVGRLITNNWVQLASLDPASGEMQFFEDGAFRPWRPERTTLPWVASSVDWFRGTRGLLPPASISAGGSR